MTAQCHALAALMGIGLAAGVIDHVNAQVKADVSNVRVTVIGCIQRSQQRQSETTGTTVIPAGGTKYVLANITLVPPDRTGAAGDTGNVLAQAVKMYWLDDSADSLIAPHVGDRVQVVGTVVAAPRSPTGTAGRTESPTIGVTSAPTIRVDSLQKISSNSPTCSK